MSSPEPTGKIILTGIRLTKAHPEQEWGQAPKPNVAPPARRDGPAVKEATPYCSITVLATKADDVHF